jgi:hypothetical protein
MGPSSRNLLNKISKTDTTIRPAPPPNGMERKQEPSQANKPLEEEEYLKKLTVRGETSPPHQTKESPFVRGGDEDASEMNSGFQK